MTVIYVKDFFPQAFLHLKCNQTSELELSKTVPSRVQTKISFKYTKIRPPDNHRKCQWWLWGFNKFLVFMITSIFSLPFSQSHQIHAILPWVGVLLSLPNIAMLCCYAMLCHASYSSPSLLNSWQIFVYLEFCVICSCAQHLATDATFVCINLLPFYNVRLSMCLCKCGCKHATVLRWRSEANLGRWSLASPSF